MVCDVATMGVIPPNMTAPTGKRTHLAMASKGGVATCQIGYGGSWYVWPCPGGMVAWNVILTKHHPKGEKAMQTAMGDATAAAVERLELCFSGPDCDWTRIYQPKNESMAMASRYQLIYPALAHFVALKRDPSQADKLRPQLDTIYRGLISERCWMYWHDGQNEQT